MKNIFRLLCVLILCAYLTLQAAAFDYRDNGYALSEDGKQRVAIPKPYTVKTVIKEFGGSQTTLNSPQDLFLSETGEYYIADTENDRIIKLDSDFQFIAEFTQADDSALSKPTGVFVDNVGDLWVADSGNARIVHLDEQGKYIEKFVKPESDLLYNVTSFVPTKIAINPINNYLYIIMGKQFMMLDAANQFKGYVGANQIGFNFFNWLVQNFASEELKFQLTKVEPPSYSNFMMTEDGRVVAVGMSSNSRISIINTVGSNIYPSGNYGEVAYEDDGTPINPLFVDVTIDDNQIISVIEQNSKFIYQYDSEGQLICFFGGEGLSAGFFGMPSSIVSDKQGNLVVLDSMLNQIQVFQPTEFISLVHNAIVQYNAGFYEESMASWDRVKEKDSTYGLSRNFIGKIRMKNGQYTEALEDFRLSGDKVNYGKTFESLRYQFLQKYFYVIVISAAVLFILLALLIKKSRKFISNLQAKLWKQ